MTTLKPEHRKTSEPELTSPAKIFIDALHLYLMLSWRSLIVTSLPQDEILKLENTCTDYQYLTVVSASLALFFNFNNLHLLFGLFFAVLLSRQFLLSASLATLFGTIGLFAGLLFPFLPAFIGTLLYPLISIGFCVYLYWVVSRNINVSFYYLEAGKITVYLLAYRLLPSIIPAFMRF